MLSDGSTVKITRDYVVQGSLSISIPEYGDLASSASDTLGSWSFTFAQRQFAASSCSGDPTSCLSSAMGSFFKSLSSIQSLLTSIASQGLQSSLADAFTDAGLSSSSLDINLDALATDLSSASSSLTSAMETMDSALNAVNSELSTLTDIELDDFKAINNKYFKAYDYDKLEDLRSILKNLAKIITKIVKAGSTTPAMEPLLTAVKANWKILTIANGIAGGSLVTGIWTSYNFANSDVDDVTDIVASNGTTNSTESDPTYRPQFIHFQAGFSIPMFDIITTALDLNQGVKSANDNSINDYIIKNGGEAVFGPAYTTNITIAMGMMLANLSFVETVYVHPTLEFGEEQKQLISDLKSLSEVYTDEKTAKFRRHDFPSPDSS